MKLLILGGTGTIGREIVYQALERGHHVTVLSRGTRQTAFDKDVQMGLRRTAGGRDNAKSCAEGQAGSGNGFGPAMEKTTQELHAMHFAGVPNS